MMRLLLTRHARTDWNGVGRYQGHTDVPLGVAGHREAAALARRLATESIDRVYTSDLRRAYETASPVAVQRSLPLYTDPRLREMNFGAWEGRTREEVWAGHAETLRAWEEDACAAAPPGGETLGQLADRVGTFLADLTAAAPSDATVLVVGHGGSLQMLLCLVLGMPPRCRWQFRLEHAGLSELLVYPEGAIVSFLNDTHHLRGATHAG
jgi:alpha-ribazole phosphatase